MIIKLGLCFFLTYLSIAQVLANSEMSNLIIPGESVGIITSTTSEDNLLNLLPANQITRVLYIVGEGALRCATEIFPNSNKTVTIVWKDGPEFFDSYDEATLKKCYNTPKMRDIEFVVISKESSYWRTSSGIRAGMNLEQLEEVNKAPVTFGFCYQCCARSNLVSWNEGEISSNIGVLFDYAGSVEETLHKYRASTISSRDLPSKVKRQIIAHDTFVFFAKDNTLKP